VSNLSPYPFEMSEAVGVLLSDAVRDQNEVSDEMRTALVQRDIIKASVLATRHAYISNIIYGLYWAIKYPDDEQEAAMKHDRYVDELIADLMQGAANRLARYSLDPENEYQKVLQRLAEIESMRKPYPF